MYTFCFITLTQKQDKTPVLKAKTEYFIDFIKFKQHK